MPALHFDQNEKRQWTEGAPNILSDMLSNGIDFLRSISTYSKTVKGKDPKGQNIESTKYFVQMPVGTADIDVTDAYQKVISNIYQFIAANGGSRLVSPTAKDQWGQPLDYSALLGAYFRQTAKGSDGEPIVQLNNDELNAVYKFVAPLAGKLTPKAYLDTMGLLHANPRDRHIAVLNDLIFKGVSLAERKAMFKDKYNKSSENFVMSMLTTVEFMRTPFRVLDAEEKASVFKAKSEGSENAKILPHDLQWTNMIKAVELSMDTVIGIKNKPAEFAKDKKYIKAILDRVQGCYGVTNANYIARQERDKLLAAIGGKGTTPESLNAYIAWYRDSIIGDGVGISAGERAKIDKMSLKELVAKYDQQQEEQQTALLGDTPENFTAYVAYYREEVIKAEGDGISEAEKAKINKMSLRELLDKNVEQQAVALKNEQDIGLKLERENAALTSDLATAKTTNAALKTELATAKVANAALKTELATAKTTVASLTDQLSTQKTEMESLIAMKSVDDGRHKLELEKQKSDLEKRNRVATNLATELRNKTADQATELAANKEKIKQLEQQLEKQLDALPAKDKSAKPVAAVAKQEQAIKADEWPLLKALSALQTQAGEPSEKSFDKKLFDFCEQKLADLRNGQIDDPAKMLGEIKVLTKIMAATKTIEGILNTSASGQSKASIIHNAMKGMDVEKRHELLQIKNLKPGQEFPTAQGFVDGLLIQRAMIFKTAEASSFSMFKKEMAKISSPLVEPEVTQKHHK